MKQFQCHHQISSFFWESQHFPCRKPAFRDSLLQLLLGKGLWTDAQQALTQATSSTQTALLSRQSTGMTHPTRGWVVPLGFAPSRPLPLTPGCGPAGAE